MKREGRIVLIGLGFASLLGLSSCGLLPAVTTAQTPVAAPAPVPALAPAPVASSAIAVYATYSDGSPLGDALVYARPLDGTAAAAAPAAVLDILQRHFEPEVLAVHTGTVVTVENHDDVSHDVYSFSDAGPFSAHLAVGAGQALPAFSRAGVVVVGCKIHSDMQGYIYVTDAPYFGKTDSHGFFRLAGLPAGRYSFGIWRAGETPTDLPGYPRTLILTPGSEQVLRVRL